MDFLLPKKSMWFAAAGVVLGVAALELPGFALGADQGTPVLVELFTSEGCSDCPPADRLLEQLDKTQPLEGVRAIVLSEHVTYWDRQGWRDPFSLDEITERQQAYGARFGLPSVYTPQMVVDGTTQFVGSDARALESALRAEAAKPRQELAIENARWENGALAFSVRGTESKGERITAVVAADATQSQVARGENAGRTLHHVAVVRSLKEFSGQAMDGRELKIGAGNLPAGPARLVVFVVDAKTGHVQGVTEQTLAR